MTQLPGPIRGREQGFRPRPHKVGKGFPDLSRTRRRFLSVLHTRRRFLSVLRSRRRLLSLAQSADPPFARRQQIQIPAPLTGPCPSRAVSRSLRR